MDKIDEASEKTGLPKQEIIRLCTAIGLEDLRKLNWDIAGNLSNAAEGPRPGKKAALTVHPKDQADEA